jgi:hypothetical protein
MVPVTHRHYLLLTQTQHKMNTSATTIKIPSISGINASDKGKLFDAIFWKDAPMDPQTKDWKTPRPLIGGIGSLGLGHCVDADLKELWSKSNNDVKVFDYLIKTNWKSENLHRRPHDLEALKAFFAFAEGDQLHFFLRNGQTILGLCKKIGGYSFDSSGMRYQHRISFEFLRHATDDEQKEFNMVILGVETKRVLKNGEPRIMTGKIRSFMTGSTFALPSVKAPAEEVKKDDPGKRLVEISNELSAITETIKALAIEQGKLMLEQCEIQTMIKPAPVLAPALAPAPAPAPAPASPGFERTLVSMTEVERMLLKGQELRDRHAVLAGLKIGRKGSGHLHNKQLLIAEILRLEGLRS